MRKLDAFLRLQADAVPDQPRPLAEMLIKNGFLHTLAGISIALGQVAEIPDCRGEV